MENSDILEVDFAQLSDLGTYLTDQSFDKDFEALNNRMSDITDSWFDLEGKHFKEVFQSFMRDAKQINDCVVELGEFATTMSEEYQTILEDHVSSL